MMYILPFYETQKLLKQDLMYLFSILKSKSEVLQVKINCNKQILASFEVFQVTILYFPLFHFIYFK